MRGSPPRNHIPGPRRPIFPQTSGEDKKKVFTPSDVQFSPKYRVKTKIKKKKGLHAFQLPIFPQISSEDQN